MKRSIRCLVTLLLFISHPAIAIADDATSFFPKLSNILATSKGLPHYGKIIIPIYLREGSLSYVIDTKFFNMSDDRAKLPPSAQPPLYLAISVRDGEYTIFDTGFTADAHTVAPYAEYGGRCHFVQVRDDKLFRLFAVDLVKTGAMSSFQYFLMDVPRNTIALQNKVLEMCRGSEPIASTFPEAKPYFTISFQTPANTEGQPQ